MVRELRAAGMTNERIACAVGVTAYAVGTWVNRAVRPHPETLARLTDLYAHLASA